ncbi:MAG TPA: PAS domain-containing sensor histidine kinase [Pirellulales bacterium]|nr:PAS domain-containing sensor histidine kinase [Pirellulales bacterium]
MESLRFDPFTSATTLMLATTSVVLAWLMYRAQRRVQAARRYLMSVCDALDAGSPQEELLPSPELANAGDGWAHLLRRVSRTLTDHVTQAADAEAARSTLDLRCRKAIFEQERMAAIIASIPEPIVAIDAYDEVVIANRSAEELLQLDGRAAGSRALENITRCERLITLFGETRKRRLHGIRSEPIELENAQGERRWYNVTISTLAADRPNPNDRRGGGMVAVLRDISDQRELQRQHAEFVSSASHEMKAPLSGIKAYVELLADAPDEATRESFLEVINAQSDRLQRLVENLLNIARIEAGVVRVSKQSQGLNELLSEAANVIQPSADAKQIALRYEPSPLYLSVLVDRDMMLQAAINLLSNAVKYTAEGGSVILRSRLNDDQVIFEVEDTGVGLSKEDCAKIFNKFYRVDKDKNMAPGTGLGLALAKSIVEEVHGGRLSVSSTLGVGSKFTVILPLAGRGNNSTP